MNYSLSIKLLRGSMKISKDNYPEGKKLRAVWECCYELYNKLGRVPTVEEFNFRINSLEPERKGISTHHRQRIEWERRHGFRK